MVEGKHLYYPDDKDFSIYNAKLTDTLSCASEFEFKMPVANKMYDSLEERISMIQILRNEEEIFYGEVREISEDLEKVKEIYCVSELAFLFDSTQPQKRYQNATPQQMFIELLNIHNSKVEAKKQFVPGIVTVTDPNDSIYRYTNYEDTLTAIRKKLCEPLDGYLRVRKVDGVRYLDLVRLEDYGVSADQPIQFGRNLLKYNSKRSGSSIATVCIPRGAKLETQVVEGLDSYTDITSVNDGKDYVINEEAYKTYGWIEKVVDFENVTVPANLKTKAEEWINNNQYKTLSLELKAVDLAELNANLEPYKTGDMIRAIAEPFGMNMWFPLMKKVTYINDSITNDVSLSYEAKVTYTSQQSSTIQSVSNAIPQNTIILELAKKNASEILKTATEGHVYLVNDESGAPKELLIMDTADINTAKKVWRWNINGLGYSSTGYDGEYNLAITMDGQIVADFITVGTLSADRISGGEITTSSFNIQGTVTKNASDYTQDDVDRINNILLEQITPTADDYEKYDLNGDGIISMADLVACNQFVQGLVESQTYDASIKISAKDEKEVVKLAEVAIGAKFVRATNIIGTGGVHGKSYRVLTDGSIKYGTDGTFTTEDGQTVTVTKGIITGIN